MAFLMWGGNSTEEFTRFFMPGFYCFLFTVSYPVDLSGNHINNKIPTKSLRRDCSFYSNVAT